VRAATTVRAPGCLKPELIVNRGVFMSLFEDAFTDMSDYYTGWRARGYNFFWHSYSQRTLLEAETMIDMGALQHTTDRLARSPRALDVACGTGLLLTWLLEHVSEVDAYGVDASEDMLAQASSILKKWPQVHLERRELGTDNTAGLPFAPGTFDLVTCTNALHYLSDPVATLQGLGNLLAPAGQLVLEDYWERELPLFRSLFRWLVRRVDPRHVRTYSLEEARSLCEQAGLAIACEKTFDIDWLCKGWVLCMYTYPA
jgi:ubiquinone/menaquinone biosynthesis C-methylase UbiE